MNELMKLVERAEISIIIGGKDFSQLDDDDVEELAFDTCNDWVADDNQDISRETNALCARINDWIKKREEEMNVIVADDDALIQSLWMANVSVEQIAQLKGVHPHVIRKWLGRNVRDNGDLK